MAFRTPTVYFANNPATIVIDKPTGTAENDIVWIVVAVDYTEWNSFASSGFTVVDDGDINLDGQSYALMWKRAGASEPSTYTVTFSRGADSFNPEVLAACVAASGRHATDPPVRTVATSSASNSLPTTATATGVTALDGDDLLWICVPDSNNSTAVDGFTPPSGFTEIVDDLSGDFTSIGIAKKENVSAGATGNIGGTITGSDQAGWAAFLIRIPEAAAGASPLFDSLVFDSVIFDTGAGGGPTEYPKTLTFSGVGAVARSQTSSRSAAKAFSGSGSVTYTSTSSRNKAFSVSGAGTSQQTALSTRQRLLEFSGTGALASVSKQVAYLLSLGFGGVGSLLLDKVKYQLAGIISPLPGWLARVGSAIAEGTTYYRDLTFAGEGTPALNFIRTLSKALVFAGAGTVSFGKALGRSVSRAFSGTASVLRTSGLTLTLVRVYASTATQVLGKSLAKNLALSATGAVTKTRQLGKRVAVAATGTVEQLHGLLTQVVKTLSGTGVVTSLQEYLPFVEPGYYLRAVRRFYFTMINRR